MGSVPDILAKIVEAKRHEVDAARRAMPLAEIQSRLSDREDTPRGFERALRDARLSGWTPIIAEVKKGSPSRGVIRHDFDPVGTALVYQENGATCVSVLTDEPFFHGSLRHLSLIREQVSLPLLRKDFIIDPYQIHEAFLAGADAILLIAAILPQSLLGDLYAEARTIGLDVLIEVHDEGELEDALKVPCGLLGINNRNLHTFETDLATTERLAPLIPSDRLIVAESGICCRADVERLLRAGAGAFLVGESLMKDDDPGGKLRELLGE
ncbi:MAG: indole-3-glycerol phosphate synthase TrpC [Desulfuromonadia bacterium]